MKILTKKILRDIRFHKGRSLSIIIIIAIAMGLYAGILISYENIDAAFIDVENELNMHSVRYQSNLPIDRLQIDLSLFDEVVAVDSRLALITSFTIDGQDRSYTAPYFGIPEGDHPTVSDFILETGRLMEQTDEIVLEHTFFASNDIELGEFIDIKIGNQTIEKEVVGSVSSPEFIYKVNPKTGLPDISGIAPVWEDLDTVQDAFDYLGVNEILVRFTDEIHRNQEVIDQHIEGIQDHLEELLEVSLAATELSDESDQQIKEGDLGALDDFARVFGGVVLLIALFAIYDNISKLIANQRNYIGTMRALGGSKWKVAGHYTTMATFLSIIGVLIGVLLAWLIEIGMVSEYVNIVGIIDPVNRLYLLPILEATGIILGLAFIISVLTSFRAASITPREAMSSSYITQVFRSKPLVERILGAISRFEPTSVIPIRNIFRNKRKSILTILTFSMSILLMTSALGFVDSFNSSINDTYDNKQKYDMEIYFTGSVVSDNVLSTLEDIDGIDIVETFISQTISIELNGNTSKTTSVYAYQAGSQLRNFEITEGDQNGMIISGLLANDLNVSVGDTLEFLNEKIEISGISNELISESVFLSLDHMQEITSMGSNVTGAIITMDSGADSDDLEEDIKDSLPIAVIIVTENVKDSIQTLIQGLFAIIGVMVFIGLLTVALFSFNTIVLEIISRENEFINLKSLGASKRKILKIILIQSLVVSIVGSALAIPLSYLVSDAVIKAMMADLMSIKTVIEPRSFVISIGAALLASMTGIIAAYRHVRKIDLVEAMRNRVSN